LNIGGHVRCMDSYVKNRGGHVRDNGYVRNMDVIVSRGKYCYGKDMISYVGVKELHQGVSVAAGCLYQR
jgi:hypothetical protein